MDRHKQTVLQIHDATICYRQRRIQHSCIRARKRIIKWDKYVAWTVWNGIDVLIPLPKIMVLCHRCHLNGRIVVPWIGTSRLFYRSMMPQYATVKDVFSIAV